MFPLDGSTRLKSRDATTEMLKVRCVKVHKNQVFHYIEIKCDSLRHKNRLNFNVQYLSTVFTVTGYSVYKNVHPGLQVFKKNSHTNNAEVCN